VSGWLYIPLALAAASICPLHMWWQHHRGRQPACCPPGRRSSADEGQEGDELIALRRRQAELAVRLTAFEAQPKRDLSEASHRQRDSAPSR